MKKTTAARPRRRHRKLAAPVAPGRDLLAVVSSAPVVLWAVDLEKTITLAEGRGLEALGRRKSGLVGRPAERLLGELDGAMRLLERALGGEKVRGVLRGRGLVLESAFFPEK